MLLEISGKPLILHTVDRAKEAATVDEVIVATDDARIFDAVTASGNRAVMTSSDHQSGSDRIAEVARDLSEGSIIVNVQGDEPLISSATIDAAVAEMLNGTADIVTTYEVIDSVEDLENPNIVKIVATSEGRALYFSRSPMPFPREASIKHGGPQCGLMQEPALFANYKKHTGLYVYRRDYLLKFTNLRQTSLEKLEMLEQLRALEDGADIRIVPSASSSIGVDTREDFERVKDLVEVNVDFRPARRSDLAQVAAVHVDSWRRSFAGIVPSAFLASMSVEKRLKAYSERSCDEEYTMLVAEHSIAGIIGFADFGTPKLPGDFDSQIFSFYFLPEYQRKGLGERLFRHCVRRIVDSEGQSLCLDSLEVSPYRQFYEKMGGSVVGSDAHKLGDEDFETVIYGWDDISKI